MRVIPRPYQELAITAALTGLLGSLRRALVVLATGLGKTLVAAFITKQLRPKRVLFLAHSNFILKHAVGEFRLVFGNKIQMATYNGHTKRGASSAAIVFATWQTMGKNLSSWAPDYFDLIIVDEAHHTEAGTYRPVVDYFTGAKLGITATPDREDEADIREVFGEEVVNITLEEAIARGWLPKIEYHVVTDNLDEDTLQAIVQEIREGKKRFTMAEVNRRLFIHKRDEEIALKIAGHEEKAIVFCASIDHANRMQRYLPDSAIFHSNVGNNPKDTWHKNQVTLEALGAGAVRRVCAVDAFNEGVNVPSVGLVAFCRATDSLTIFRQQLGRGLRPGKEKLIVLDFVGNLERIQLVIQTTQRIADFHERHSSPKEREREGYQRGHFEVSGAGFEFTFSEQIVDLMEVLRHVVSQPYPTWQEASAAAKVLGIKNVKEYLQNYKKDARLPSSPSFAYPNFPGMGLFLDTGKTRKSRSEMHPTWQIASTAAKGLGIKTSGEYRERYKRDPGLTSRPERVYKNFPGWGIFLGTDKKRRRSAKGTYPTWQKASEALKRLGIKSSRDYQANYNKDAKLPGAPHSFYHDFPGWKKFLGKK